MQKRLVILVTGTILSFSAADQNEKVFITDKVSNTYAYVDVMKTYERIAAKGYKSVDLFQKLGDSSYSHFKLENAAEWYGKLFSLTLDLAPEYYYRYAESLRFICENAKTDAVIEKLKTKVTVKKRV
ncbi:flagellar motor protein MotB [Flavobacterium flavigenum]|uniref:flagellar motor protein MotB n=1 Tax=Flavobacterium flavigenum TaxID=3003258 RepID=UPI0022AC331C|nr:flagellar motor protein MotB [Flavobacterium flavigenum]